MYKETLRAIVGIGTFPVISLVLFVTVFTVAAVRAFRMQRTEADRFASLPLEDAVTTGAGQEVAR